MSYGYDITEGLPLSLSNPVGAISYSSNSEAYDIAINDMPFLLHTGDEFPHTRETAQYRKQQIDQSNEPGEQSITGWWVRAQSSFHGGTGINFYDPASGESIDYRYFASQGVNPWVKGQVTLLKDTTNVHVTTGAVVGTDHQHPNQHVRSIQWSGINAVLLHDEFDVDKISPAITVSINNKARTTNVATLTTTAAHGLAVGMTIVITGVDATFNGTYRITAVPTTTTFTYTTATSGTVASTAVSPVGTGVTDPVVHFIDYISGTDRKVFAICDDGVNAYWVTNKTSGGNQRLTMFKKPLTGDSVTGSSNPSASGDVTQMFQDANIEIQYAAMEFVKDRIILCVNNNVYELPTNATSLTGTGGGTLVYTNPNTNYHYTSVAASGPAIYTAGHSGIYSTIQKYTLGTNGSMPVLTQAVVAAEFPSGEIIEKIYYYLGYMIIGTSKGLRVSNVNDQDGSLQYGPLIFESTQPVYDVACADRFAWVTTGASPDAGLTRVDLSQIIEGEPLRFAYASDLVGAHQTDHPTTAVAFMGTTNRLVFCTAYDTTDGGVYLESASTLVPSGYITTGAIRYGTLENKIFKNIKARIDNTNGGITIRSVDKSGAEYQVGSFAQGDFTPEASVSYPVGAQEYLSFKFTISRSSTDTTKGPIFSGYQLKSLPAVSRQRLISYPLLCYDREKDSFGNQVGHEGAAYDKLTLLETVESLGDTIRVEDFRTGESYLGLIESIQFINRTPSDKRFSGFGGILVATIRTI
jgi:hypothetical protein